MAEPARGQDVSHQGWCTLGEKKYPENATVCSNGLEQHCENGVWQNNSGTRCDAGDGDYLTPQRAYQEESDEPIPEYYKEKYPWLNLK